GVRVREAMTLQRTGAGRADRRFLRLLVVLEVAAAVVVLAGAGLVADGLRRQLAADPGYAASGLYVFEVDLPSSRYGDAAAIARFAREAAERVRAVAGVQSATVTTTQPLDPGTTEASANLAERPAPDPPGYYFVEHRQVLPGYFAAMGMRLLAGRGFATTDVRGAE